jgi:hypothetical protein
MPVNAFLMRVDAIAMRVHALTIYYRTYAKIAKNLNLSNRRDAENAENS